MRDRCLIVLLTMAMLPTLSSGADDGEWTYVQLDDDKGKWGDWGQPEWLRYFGLDAGDIDGDGDLDVLSGRYLYRNPGGNLAGQWERITLPENVDGILLLDVDGDAFADGIAQALPDVLWIEATDARGSNWTLRVVGTVPATSHTNSQGFERGQLVPGGREEFVIAGDGSIYQFEIPEDPENTPWPRTLVAANTSDEGIGLGDLDGDGTLDITAGRRPASEDEPRILVAFTNPGDGSHPWPAREVGRTPHPIDRIEVADLNGDDRTDIVVAEERWPGKEPDGNLFWFEQPVSGDWTRHSVVTQYSMNNLDVADLDRDGDIDLVTAEHKGPRLEVQQWINNGEGRFDKEVIDAGKENHLGTQLADLDGDGDLDLLGAGWDQYPNMHVWRNDRVESPMRWKRLGPQPGDVFREYVWLPNMVAESTRFLRVGGRLDYQTNAQHFPPEHHRDGAIPFGTVLDLAGATRAELVLERVFSHEDTKGLRVQVNEHDWLPVPDPAGVPRPASDYMVHDYPAVAVPLNHLRDGADNTFKLEVDPDQRWNWPQNLFYGVLLRVYYPPDDRFSLTGLEPGSALATYVRLGLEPRNSDTITRVDFLGRFDDFNWEGDGVYRQWHYTYHRGVIRNHLGSVEDAPFRMNWDTTWVPDQFRDIEVAARVTDGDGRIYLTRAVGGLTLDRSYAVELCRPYRQPTNWVTREGEKTAYFAVHGNPADAESMQVAWRSWSPCYARGVLINGREIFDRTPPCYDYAEHRIDIADPEFLKQGENIITTGKTPKIDGKMVHGMEVQWPGIMAKIRYRSRPEAKVRIEEGTFAGRPHYLVHTPAAVYYYDQAGGGLSRMIDPDGRDWIGYWGTPWGEYPAAAASAFRGLPNLVFRSDDGGAGHPGHDQCQSRLVGDRSIQSTSKSGTWQWTWTFGEDHARLDLSRVDPDHPYWFLYEGAPGGTFDPAALVFGTNTDGPRVKPPDYLGGQEIYESWQWAYVGHRDQDRVLVLAQLTADTHMDTFGVLGNTEAGLQAPDGMVVFGFGRAKGATPLITTPGSFVIQFRESAVTSTRSHDELSSHLTGLLEP